MNATTSIQNDENIQDDELLINGAFESKKDKNNEEKCCIRFLKKVSLGKYRTPLYYKDHENFSSAFGGVISIICLSFFIGYALTLIASVFKQTEWDLKAASQNLSYISQNVSSDKIIEAQTCDDQHCKDLSVKQFIESYFENNPLYCVAYKKQDWQNNKNCQNVNISFMFDRQSIKNFTKQNSNIFDISISYQCCVYITAKEILALLQKQNVDLEQNALIKYIDEQQQSHKESYEYNTRFCVQFINMLQNIEISISFDNIRVTTGGKSRVQTHTPNIKYSTRALQKFSLVQFNQYQSFTNYFFGKPDQKISTLQYISSDLDFIESFTFNNTGELHFLIQQDADIYHFYPHGLLNALVKIGGLMAILKVSMIINMMHQEMFQKEMGASQNMGHGSEIKLSEVYSIENFNKLLKRVNKMEDELAEVQIQQLQISNLQSEMKSQIERKKMV